MNSIVLPMKVHAVKLEYRRLKLEKMLQGRFKTMRGKQYVLISKDPAMPRFNTRHPRILNVDTELGRKYSERISEYIKIKTEYDELLNDWNTRYSFAPPRVNFPIKQYSDPHEMNNEYYNRQAERCGKYQPDNPTVSDHGDLKSKNELMGADLLKFMGIPFKYETEIYLEEIEETINPDCLVNFYEIDRCAYLEILGMNDKVGYSMKTVTKMNGFSLGKYRPGREVIYVLLYDKANFDRDYFVSQVMTAFNDMIPDDALVWESCQQAS
jgi:hypothetical protein